MNAVIFFLCSAMQKKDSPTSAQCAGEVKEAAEPGSLILKRVVYGGGYGERPMRVRVRSTCVVVAEGTARAAHIQSTLEKRCNDLGG